MIKRWLEKGGGVERRVGKWRKHTLQHLKILESHICMRHICSTQRALSESLTNVSFSFFFYISDRSLDKECWEFYKKTYIRYIYKKNTINIQLNSADCSHNLSLFRNWLGFKMSGVVIQTEERGKKLRAPRETVQRCVTTCVHARSITPPRIMTKKCDKYFIQN